MSNFLGLGLLTIHSLQFFPLFLQLFLNGFLGPFFFFLLLLLLFLPFEVLDIFLLLSFLFLLQVLLERFVIIIKQVILFIIRGLFWWLLSRIDAQFTKIEVFFFPESLLKFCYLVLHAFLQIFAFELVEVVVGQADAKVIVDIFGYVLYLEPFGLVILGALTPFGVPLPNFLVDFFPDFPFLNQRLRKGCNCLDILLFKIAILFDGKFFFVGIDNFLHLFPPLLVLLLSGNPHEPDSVDKDLVVFVLDFLVLVGESVIALEVVGVDLDGHFGGLNTFDGPFLFGEAEAHIEPGIFVIVVI